MTLSNRYFMIFRDPRNQTRPSHGIVPDFSNYNIMRLAYPYPRRTNRVFGFIRASPSLPGEASELHALKINNRFVRIHLMTPGNNLLIRLQSL